MEKEAKSIESIINLAVLMHESRRNVTEAEVLFVRALRMRCANDVHNKTTKLISLNRCFVTCVPRLCCALFVSWRYARRGFLHI
jgi:hypothetical protein